VVYRVKSRSVDETKKPTHEKDDEQC